MEKKNKKTYYKPEFTKIELDKEISLIMASEGNPPDPPLVISDQSDSGTSTTSTDSTEEPLKTNNFEENPFER
jgi:hypothetical protein